MELKETGLQEQWYIYKPPTMYSLRVFVVADAEEADKIKVCFGWDHYRKAWSVKDVLREHLIPTTQHFNTVPVECGELPLGTQLTLYCGCIVEKCKGPTPYPSFKLIHACSDFDRKDWNENGHRIRWQFRWDAGSILLT